MEEGFITVDVLGNPIPIIQNAKHSGNLSFSMHALERMLERHIRIEQLEQALDCATVEILENYPQTGHRQSECLILGNETAGKAIHVVVTHPLVEVITCYEPTLPKWISPRQRG